MHLSPKHVLWLVSLLFLCHVIHSAPSPSNSTPNPNPSKPQDVKDGASSSQPSTGAANSSDAIPASAQLRKRRHSGAELNLDQGAQPRNSPDDSGKSSEEVSKPGATGATTRGYESVHQSQPQVKPPINKVDGGSSTNSGSSTSGPSASTSTTNSNGRRRRRDVSPSPSTTVSASTSAPLPTSSSSSSSSYSTPLHKIVERNANAIANASSTTTQSVSSTTEHSAQRREATSASSTSASTTPAAHVSVQVQKREVSSTPASTTSPQSTTTTTTTTTKDSVKGSSVHKRETADPSTSPDNDTNSSGDREVDIIFVPVVIRPRPIIIIETEETPEQQSTPASVDGENKETSPPDNYKDSPTSPKPSLVEVDEWVFTAKETDSAQPEADQPNDNSRDVIDVEVDVFSRSKRNSNSSSTPVGQFRPPIQAGKITTSAPASSRPPPAVPARRPSPPDAQAPVPVPVPVQAQTTRNTRSLRQKRGGGGGGPPSNIASSASASASSSSSSSSSGGKGGGRKGNGPNGNGSNCNAGAGAQVSAST